MAPMSTLSAGEQSDPVLSQPSLLHITHRSGADPDDRDVEQGHGQRCEEVLLMEILLPAGVKALETRFILFALARLGLGL